MQAWDVRQPMLYVGIYTMNSIVVDTHVKRISRKLGLTKETEPEKIERPYEGAARRSLDPLEYPYPSHLGRTICTARKPDCGIVF